MNIQSIADLVPANVPADLVFDFDIYDDSRIDEDVQGRTQGF